MRHIFNFLQSTVGRKYLMALTGLVLVFFVLGHMLGNLQIFLGAEAINAYAYKLHHLLPTSALWAVRLFLLICIAIHVWTAVTLTLDNRKARPQGYQKKRAIQATYSSRTMRMSGVILLAFIIFHIAHFTVRSVPGMKYNEPGVISKKVDASNIFIPTEVPLVKKGEAVLKNGQKIMTFNVHDMMIAGFNSKLVSLFYIIATGLLCLHLTHGVSSMFQSLGIRNSFWRVRLDRLALVYGWAIFLGFAVIPIATLSGILIADPTGGLIANAQVPQQELIAHELFTPEVTLR